MRHPGADRRVHRDQQREPVPAEPGRRHDRLRPDAAGLGQDHRRATRRRRVTTRRPTLRAIVPYCRPRGLRGRQPEPDVLPGVGARGPAGLGLRGTALLARQAAEPPALCRAGRLLRRRVPRACRCAWPCCCSPSPAASGRAMAVVQVAETLELRETLARKLLVDTLWRQAGADGGDRRWSRSSWCSAPPGRFARWATRSRPAPPTTCQPIDAPDAPRELLPADRGDQPGDGPAAAPARPPETLRARQRRTSCARRSAVLKAQVQSAPPRRRGRATRRWARSTQTVERATAAGQPDAVAGEGRAAAPAGRACQAIDLARGGARGGARPVAADRRQGARLRARDGCRRRCRSRPSSGCCGELTRNLLHNAIKHSAARGGTLAVRVRARRRALALMHAQRPGPRHLGRAVGSGCSRRFRPATWATAPAWGWRSAARSCWTLGGSIALDNREVGGQVTGLDAVVRLPTA